MPRTCSPLDSSILIALSLFALGGVCAYALPAPPLSFISNEVIQNYQCAGVSPFFNIKYANQQPQDVFGVVFCAAEARRSCCDAQNFEELKMRWFRWNYNVVNVSSECQQVVSSIVCAECDSDVSIGLRRGVCPSVCKRLYETCKNDYFKFDDSTLKLRFCTSNDLLCSPLKEIAAQGKTPDAFARDACRHMGLELNENADYQSWGDDLVLGFETNAVCWDGTPSARYFGASHIKSQAARTQGTGSEQESPKASTPSAGTQSASNPLFSKYFNPLSLVWWAYALAFVIIALLITVLIFWIARKPNEVQQRTRKGGKFPGKAVTVGGSPNHEKDE